MSYYGIIVPAKRGKGSTRETKPKNEDERKDKMGKLEEDYRASKLAKAVEAAGLGHEFLPGEDVVMIHKTDYTPEEKSENELSRMYEAVKAAVESVYGRLPRPVFFLVDPDADVRGCKCCCTSATYVAAHDELTAG